ncbi:MAG: 30S ribosome-binding factor RbfA [Syntrophomonadaceae bacterium]|nr:30S ribosome-binding factor RbfA [Syntrophomonadaceae bacterium]
MGQRRKERLAEEIRRELSGILFEEVKDPRIDAASVSVTRVEVSNDLSHARIYVSVLGDTKKCQDTMTALERGRGYIRSTLAGKLNLRHAPEIVFRLDKSIEHGVRISSLLSELKGQEKGEDPHESE